MECIDATHFIWLDTDICFDERILFYIENAINVLEEEKIQKWKKIIFFIIFIQLNRTFYMTLYE